MQSALSIRELQCLTNNSLWIATSHVLEHEIAFVTSAVFLVEAVHDYKKIVYVVFSKVANSQLLTHNVRVTQLQ